MRRIDRIVLHTAAAYTGKVIHQSVEDVRRYHISIGFSDIGYNKFVTVDGRVWDGRPDRKAGAHVKGYNRHTLALCVSGHGDYEAWNERQLAAVAYQCAIWCVEHRLTASDVVGHREVSDLADYKGRRIAKTCPGTLIDMDRIRELVEGVLAGIERARSCPSGQRQLGVG